MAPRRTRISADRFRQTSALDLFLLPLGLCRVTVLAIINKIASESRNRGAGLRVSTSAWIQSSRLAVKSFDSSPLSHLLKKLSLTGKF